MIVKDEVSVLIVEDEPAWLLRLVEAVLADPGLNLVGAVGTGRAALALLEAMAPEVLLLDLGLPDMDGLDLIRHAARHSPETAIVVATALADDEHVLASIEAGARGYLLKDELPEAMAACLHEVHRGGIPISPSVARTLMARVRDERRPVRASTAGHGPGGDGPARRKNGKAPVAAALSRREIDILRLMSKGMSFAAMGAQLGISHHTVGTHIKKIYRKLGVHSRGQAVYAARQNGLL